MWLFEQYKKKTALNLKDDKENFSTELNWLQVSITDKLMDITDYIRKWIDGEEEENNQFLTDDDIIEEVISDL